MTKPDTGADSEGLLWGPGLNESILRDLGRVASERGPLPTDAEVEQLRILTEGLVPERLLTHYTREDIYKAYLQRRSDSWVVKRGAELAASDAAFEASEKFYKEKELLELKAIMEEPETDMQRLISFLYPAQWFGLGALTMFAAKVIFGL